MFTIFVVQGVTVGTWVAEIPWVQDRLDVSKTALGLILLVMSLGFILGVLVMGQVLVRLGTARGIRVAAFPSVLLVTLPLLAPSPLVLPVALLAFGVGAGALDVAMNAHGVHVEKALGRPVMSSLHAGWSLGAFLGAGAVALTTALGLDPRLHGAATALALALGLRAAARLALGGGARVRRDGRAARGRAAAPGARGLRDRRLRDRQRRPAPVQRRGPGAGRRGRPGDLRGEPDGVRRLPARAALRARRIARRRRAVRPALGQPGARDRRLAVEQPAVAAARGAPSRSSRTGRPTRTAAAPRRDGSRARG